jgi:hypothetical protein
VQGRGHAPHTADGEEEILLGGAWRQRGRKLARAEDGNLGELARPKFLKCRLILIILLMLFAFLRSHC